MSANIYFKNNKGEQLGVIQTPTQITYMLLTNEDGTISSKTGKRALHALYQYKEWVRSSINGSYSSEEEWKNMHDSIERNLKEIDGFILNSKQIKAYTL